jgi:hypothetical protein
MMCVYNETLQEARRELDDDIDCRIKRYSKCLSQKKRMASRRLQIKTNFVISKKYREKIMNEPDDEE